MIPNELAQPPSHGIPEPTRPVAIDELERQTTGRRTVAARLRGMAILVIGLGLAAGLTACDSMTSAAGVVQTEDGVPIAEASVHLDIGDHGYGITTPEDGRFDVGMMHGAAWSARLRVSAEGYAESIVPIDVGVNSGELVVVLELADAESGTDAQAP